MLVHATVPAALTLTEYEWLAATLDRRFVAVLWGRRPKRSGVLPTHLDIGRDPIVPHLRAWLGACLAARRAAAIEVVPNDDDDEGLALPAAPTYPVVDVPDPRPAEVVPEMLWATGADVWDAFAVVGARYRGAYLAAAGVTIHAAQAPADERLRQWRRLTASSHLSFGDIANCLSAGRSGTR